MRYHDLLKVCFLTVFILSFFFERNFILAQEISLISGCGRLGWV